MNLFTFLFIYLPVGVAVGLPLLYFLGHYQTAQREREEQRARADKAERALVIREEKAIRDAALHEAKIAKENNAVTLQDAKLELAQLKIQTEKRKLGINDQPFEATDYPPV